MKRSFRIFLSLAFGLAELGTAHAQTNVGIGITNPAERLHVAGAIRADALAGATNALVLTNNLGSISRLAFPGNPAVFLLGNGTFGAPAAPANTWLLLGNNGTNIATHFLGTTDAQPLLIFTDSTERMRVLANGNVGIGTVTPAAQLQVADLYAPGGANLMIGNESFWTDLDVDNSIGLYGVQDPTQAHLLLGSTALYISGGNGGIGISNVPFTPLAQLHLADNYAAGARNLIIGDQGYLTDIDQTNALGLYGNQNFDRMYLLLGSTGGWLSGLGGGIGIANFATFNPGAQLHLADNYAPGTPNLLVGDQLYLADVDINNSVSLRGMQDPNRAIVEMGETDQYWVGANGGIGISVNPAFTPQAQLHLADDLSPREPNLLVGDNAFLTDLDIDNAIGIYGNQDPAVGVIQMGSTGQYLIGANNGFGISTNPAFVPQGQLHLDDIYIPGVRNLIIGDQAYLSDMDQANTLAIVGNQNTDRLYLKLGNTGPYVSGIAGVLAVSANPNLAGAQLHVWDDYLPGGRNLLVGDGAFFSDIDVNNSFSIRGHQDPARAAVQLGDGNPYIIGANNGVANHIGIHTDATFVPQALLHVGEVLPPRSRYVLVGNDAYLTVLNGPDTLGIFGHQDSTVVNIQMASSGPMLYAANGCLGIGLPNPQYAVDLPNVATALGQARANAWVIYSSGRWKNDIRPISGAMEILMNLRGVTYDWRPGHGQGRDYGFIAEEVGAQLPRLVTWDATQTHALGLDYRRMVPFVVAAAQEQQTQLDAERQELDAIAKRMDALEQRLRER